MSRRSFVVAGVALSLAACAGAGRHERPPAVVPSTWSAPAVASAAPPAARWWTRFGDPALDALVEDALRRNADLALAALKVRRARLEAGLAASAALPSVSAGASGTVSRSLGGGGPAKPGDAGAASSYALSGAVTWELDLWGRLSSQRGAAEWEATATEQDRQGAALALTGTTATLYWKLAYLAQRRALSAESVAAARRALGIARALAEAGGGSALDVAQAEQTTASQEAAHTLLEQQLVEAREALALLFDGGLATPAAPGRLPDTLPEVPAGLPADLLARRPDVRAAELRVRSAWATSDATRASFFPALTLTGTLGASSEALSKLLQNPVGALGAALTLPFLQWRDVDRKNEVSRVDAESAVVAYRQTLYKALAEVNDALSARTQYRLQAAQLERSLAAARRAEALSEVRYRAGAVLLKFWLDAQEARRQAEVALLDNRYQQLLTHVALTEALGGDAAIL